MTNFYTASSQNIVRLSKELPPGGKNTQLKISFEGYVTTVKSNMGDTPLFFRCIGLHEDTEEILVRWIPQEGKYRTFDWVDEMIEEDCRVLVEGWVRNTKKGKAMIDAKNVEIIAHPTDSEDLEETREEDDRELLEESDDSSDEDYVPDSEPEADDDEDFDKYIDQPVVSKIRQLKVNHDISLTPESLIFHGRTYSIDRFSTAPGRLIILTVLGDFYFDRMDEAITSIMVPQTFLEPQFSTGYTTLSRVPFRELLDILF